MKQSAIKQARDFMAKSNPEPLAPAAEKEPKTPPQAYALTPAEKKRKTGQGFVGGKGFGLLGDMFRNSDNMLIIVLILLLMDEKENFPLVFALLFLLV